MNLNLQALKKLLLLLNRKPSHEELLVVFGSLISLILHQGKITEDEIKNLGEKGKELLNIISDDTKLTNLKKELEEAIENLKMKEGPKGEDGKTPTSEELLALIQPLILPPERGKKGDKGESIVGPPGPPGESIRGPQGPQGEKGLDGMLLEPGEIRDKLETLIGNERLKITAIDGWEEEVSKIVKAITPQKAPIFGRAYQAAFTEFPATESPDGNRLVFTIPKGRPDYIVTDGVWRKQNAGWTWSGNQATFSIPPSYEVYGIKNRIIL